MGELSLRIFLRQELKDQGRADAAAAGWGGDRFAVYEGKDGRLVAWITEWDAAADAEEFRSALQGRGGWRVEAAGPGRVLAVRGTLPEERWAGVRTRLAVVPAERPANKEIDLKAIGAVPATMDEAALQEMLKNPVLQEQMEGLEKEPPAGEVSADGRVYTNPGLGFSIRLPESFTGWTLEKDPTPPFLVTISRLEEKVKISVGHQDLPAGYPAEAATEIVELGIKSALPGFQRLGGTDGQRDGFKLRDILFSATIENKRVLGVLRLMMRDSEMFMLIAAAPGDSWERYQESSLQIINTFRPTEPGAGKP
jgi:hypothetical protein